MFSILILLALLVVLPLLLLLAFDPIVFSLVSWSIDAGKQFEFLMVNSAGALSSSDSPFDIFHNSFDEKTPVARIISLYTTPL